MWAYACGGGVSGGGRPTACARCQPCCCRPRCPVPPASLVDGQDEGEQVEAELDHLALLAGAHLLVCWAQQAQKACVWSQVEGRGTLGCTGLRCSSSNGPPSAPAAQGTRPVPDLTCRKISVTSARCWPRDSPRAWYASSTACRLPYAQCPVSSSSSVSVSWHAYSGSFRGHRQGRAAGRAVRRDAARVLRCSAAGGFPA